MAAQRFRGRQWQGGGAWFFWTKRIDQSRPFFDEPVVFAKWLQEADGFKLGDGRLELAGDLCSAFVVAAQADMLVCEFLQVEIHSGRT